MKCNSCAYEWYYPPDWTSPYGEWACMKDEMSPLDLYGTKNEDVENCPDYKPKTGYNKGYEDVVENIKSYNRR